MGRRVRPGLRLSRRHIAWPVRVFSERCVVAEVGGAYGRLGRGSEAYGSSEVSSVERATERPVTAARPWQGSVRTQPHGYDDGAEPAPRSPAGADAYTRHACWRGSRLGCGSAAVMPGAAGACGQPIVKRVSRWSVFGGLA